MGGGQDECNGKKPILGKRKRLQDLTVTTDVSRADSFLVCRIAGGVGQGAEETSKNAIALCLSVLYPHLIVGGNISHLSSLSLVCLFSVSDLEKYCHCVFCLSRNKMQFFCAVKFACYS